MRIQFRQGLGWTGRSPFSLVKSMMKFQIPAFVLLGFFVSCAGTAPETTRTPQQTQKQTKEYNSRAIEHYMEGVTAQMQGNYAMAALELQEALRYDSTSVTIYTDLAQTYLMLRKFQQAKRIIQRGLENTGEQEQLLPMLGEVYGLSREFDKAIAVYERILDEIADEEVQEEALRRLGEIYARQKKYLKVAEIYEQLYHLDTDRIDYLKKAQQIYLRAGQFDDVKRVLRTLSEDHPDGENYPLEMAKVYAESGNTDSAIVILQNLVEENSDEQYHLLLGELYFRTGNADSAYQMLRPFYHTDSTDTRILYYLGGTALNLSEEAFARQATVKAERFLEEAERYYRQLLEHNRSIPGGYYGLALTLQRQEKYPQAIDILQKGTRQFKEEAGLYEQLGITYYLQQQYDSARAALTHALSIDSTRMRPRHFLAFTYDQLGQTDSAEVMYKELLESAPQEPLYLNNLAYLYATQGKNLEQALKMVNTAMKMEPDNASYLDTKGWIYYQLEKFEKAKTYIEKALQLDGKNAEVLEHLGDVYMKLGDTSVAQRLYKRALNLDPDNKALHRKLRTQ